MGEPRLVAAVRGAAAGDLSINGLVALRDPSCDGLHRLRGGYPVCDLDAVVLGEVAVTDCLVDKVHAASDDEP